MGKLTLPILELEIDAELWHELIRKFAIENQYEGNFLAKEHLALTATNRPEDSDPPLNDALDFIKFVERKNFSDALKKKYRIGDEFSDDEDAHEIFDKAFVTAEMAAMRSLGYNYYSVDTLIYLEIYYWATLQILRMARGEYVDRRNLGNQARMGDNLDLAGSDFAELASEFYTVDEEDESET